MYNKFDYTGAILCIKLQKMFGNMRLFSQIVGYFRHFGVPHRPNLGGKIVGITVILV